MTAVLAFVLKFDLALRTFGTNDVAIFTSLAVCSANMDCSGFTSITNISIIRL